MSAPLAILALIAGVTLLLLGSEALVRGAARIARALGMRPFLIGVTIVAFGTSAPELFASIGFAISGESGAAITNVVGSNTANIGLILGLTAVARPVPVDRIILRRDLPLMIALTTMASLTFLDFAVTRAEGVVLVLGIVGYVYISHRTGKSDPEAIRHELEREAEHGLDLVRADKPARIWANLLLAIAGLAGLVLGARLGVAGATTLATRMGVPPEIVSLTMVAFGTSLPELGACLAAARQREPDIALGNVFGSNVFNLLSVMGVAALVHPLRAPGDIWTHVAVMHGFALGAALLLGPTRRLGRAGGSLLFTGYLVYVILVFVQTTGS